MEPFFFQLLDRVRFQAALNALGPECKSLALISPVQALADHYKDALLEQLQLDWPGLEVKSFFPADSDSIVHAFNQRVAEMSVSEALNPHQAPSDFKIWVVHNASALPEHELLLLLQLLEKFPGAQVKAMLVYAGVEMWPDGLDGFERSLMKWIVERPKLVQIKEAVSLEHDPDRAARLRELIQQMVPGSVAATSFIDSEKTPTLHSPSEPPPPKAKKGTLKSWLIATFTVLLLLAGSIGLVMQLHTDSISKPWVKWVSEWMYPSDSKKSEPPPEGANSASVQASAVEQPASQVQTQASEGAQSIPSPHESPASLVTQAKTDVITEWPDEALKGEKWAWQLTVSQTVIQHSIDPSHEKMLQIKAKYPDLKELHIVPQFIGSESQARFALVSGPFATKAEADAFLKTHPLPKDSWVKKASALQERLMSKTPDASKP